MERSDPLRLRESARRRAPGPAARQIASRTGFPRAVLLAAVIAAWVAASGRIFGAPAPAAATPADADALLSAWRRAEPSNERSVGVRDLEFESGPARFSLREGRLFPVAAPPGPARAFVFVGDATIAVVPPDEVEAGQLELFTGSRTLDTPFTEAVFVVLDEALARRLLEGAGPAAPSSDTVAAAAGVGATPAGHAASRAGSPATGAEISRAERLYDRWEKGAVRRSWGIEGKILRAGWGDAGVAGYFAAFVESSEIGPFHFVLDPETPESAWLGSFLSPEELEREARLRLGALDIERRGPTPPGFAGAGFFDTWMSAALPVSSGRVLEAKAYTLDAAIGSGGRTLQSRERLELSARGSGGRAAELLWDAGLRVRRVTDAAGRELFTSTSEGRLLVLLPEPVPAGGTTALGIEFSRTIARPVRIQRASDLPPIAWYPRLSLHDEAVTEATFHWPKDLTLLAGGRLLERGEDASGDAYEKRRLEPPFDLAGFEVGDYELRHEQAGPVAVTIAFDESGRLLPAEEKETIVRTVRDALAFDAELFGAYPFADLAVVTVPEVRSAGRPGLVTLSVPGLTPHPAARPETELDPRLLVAHEVAHQWWGDLIATASYREAWLSEGMAHYAALLYGRRRLEGEVNRLPTANWRAELAALTPDGRAVESLGPLVLGRRLDSSLSSRGFETIVYKKGAVVLDMLARVFGEDRFATLLGEVARELSGHPASTRDFFAAVERRSGERLDWFVHQYVEGTGIPDVSYAWSSSRTSSGRWVVEGSMSLLMPPAWRYRLEETPAGWDVRREAAASPDASAWNLAVPFVVTTRAAEGQGAGKELHGRIVMKDLAQPFVIDIEDEPEDLWLDRRGEVLARFFSEARAPKLSLQEQALQSLAHSQPAEAAAAWRRSLAAVPPGPAPAGADERLDRDRLRRQDAVAHLGLARLLLDSADLPGAERELVAARSCTDRLSLYSVREELLVLTARLDLLRGDAGRAWSALRSGISDRGVPGPEGQALLVLAARASGHDASYRRALTIARKRGVDVSPLANAGGPRRG